MNRTVEAVELFLALFALLMVGLGRFMDRAPMRDEDEELGDYPPRWER
jgi:hypothetical protein